MTITLHTFPAPPRASSSRTHAIEPPKSVMSYNAGRNRRGASSESETLMGDGHTGLSDEVRDVKMDLEDEVEMIESEEEDDNYDERPVIHSASGHTALVGNTNSRSTVEVRLKSHSNMALSVRKALPEWVTHNLASIRYGMEIHGWEDVRILKDNIEKVWVDDSG
jgi:hypothetical protein